MVVALMKRLLFLGGGLYGCSSDGWSFVLWGERQCVAGVREEEGQAPVAAGVWSPLLLEVDSI